VCYSCVNTTNSEIYTLSLHDALPIFPQIAEHIHAPQIEPVFHAESCHHLANKTQIAAVSFHQSQGICSARGQLIANASGAGKKVKTGNSVQRDQVFQNVE